MIEILLPVYNGEKFLREQIDSILNQTNKDWILKIRNDGSTDTSQEIIQEYCAEYPDKIKFLKDPEHNVGLVNSLNLLLESAKDADYVMFSDQDDIWLPDKIDVSLREVRSIERNHPHKAAMICTDATCVDAELNIIYHSFYESQKFLPDIIGDKYKMLAVNQVQGCTIMLNKVAYDKIYPLPTFMKIHDMWVGVICAHYGIVNFIHHPTLLYRQHSQNTLGGASINLQYFTTRLRLLGYLINSRRKLFKILPFKVNSLKWIGQKIYYSIKRSFS